MPLRQNNHKALLKNRNKFHIALRLHHGAENQIILFSFQIIQQRFRVALVAGKRDILILRIIQKACNQSGDKVRPDRCHIRQSDVSAPFGNQTFNLIFSQLQLCQGVFHIEHINPPIFCQNNISALLFKQICPQFLFHGRNGVAERRLRNIQLFRRLSIMLQFCQRFKIIQLV